MQAVAVDLHLSRSRITSTLPMPNSGLACLLAHSASVDSNALLSVSLSASNWNTSLRKKAFQCSAAAFVDNGTSSLQTGIGLPRITLRTMRPAVTSMPSIKCDVAGLSWPASTLAGGGRPIGASEITSMIKARLKLVTSREYVICTDA